MVICARLSIWNTPMVSARQIHVVDVGIVLRHQGEIEVPGVVMPDELEALGQAGQHAQSQDNRP